VGEFLKPCGNGVQVNCPFSAVLDIPIGRQDELALWGQTDAEKCVLKVQAGKELCLNWDKAQKCVRVWDRKV
jgi:hypothetical protein